MHFTASVIAFAILADSAKLGEVHRKLINKKASYKQMKTSRDDPSNAKPMWKDIKDLTEDVHGSLSPNHNECDLDIGILVCGKDEVCVPNIQSKHGGYCGSKLREETSRGLQETGFDFYSKFCQDESSTYDCSCADFDRGQNEGEISCTQAYCNVYDETLCGTAFTSYYFENGYMSKYSYCVELKQERFCLSVDINPSTQYFEDCLATMNGCDCSCGVDPSGCDTYEFFEFTCPGSASIYSCAFVLTPLFGNNNTFCDGTSSINTISSNRIQHKFQLVRAVALWMSLLPSFGFDGWSDHVWFSLLHHHIYIFSKLTFCTITISYPLKILINFYFSKSLVKKICTDFDTLEDAFMAAAGPQ